MAYEGLLANLLALPSTLEDQGKANAMARALLGPQGDAPGILPPDVLNQVYPETQPFPGMNVPVLGHILKGVGETGQLLQTALGQSPDAPRIPEGTLVQIQNLRSQQAQRKSLLGLADQVAPEQRQNFIDLVNGGNEKLAMKMVPGLGAGGFPTSTNAQLAMLAREQLMAEGFEQPSPKQVLERTRELRIGEKTEVARAMSPIQISRSATMAGISAGLSDANAQKREGRAADRKAEEDAEQQQQLDDFRAQNPGAGSSGTVPVRPRRGFNPISYSLLDEGSAGGFDPLANTETSRTESPTNLSITKVTPLERQQAVKALQEQGQAGENPDGSYSEAQLLQYVNAVKGASAQATALGGLAPGVVGARAHERTQLGLAEVLPIDEAIAWGVPVGTTVGELRDLQQQGAVSEPSVGTDAESRKELRRIRAARTALTELVGATDALTTNPALAASRLQGLGLEWNRLSGDPKAAQIAAGSMIAPTLRKAFGDTGNMAVQEQQITMDAVIPNSADTAEAARNKLLVMDRLLALMEESVTGQQAGPGVRERIIAEVEAVDPTIRQKLGAAPGAGGPAAGDVDAAMRRLGLQ